MVDVNEKIGEYLDTLVGEKLLKKERESVIEFFEEFGIIIQGFGINTLNGYLKDIELPFIIQQEKNYWIIGKIVY